MSAPVQTTNKATSDVGNSMQRQHVEDRGSQLNTVRVRSPFRLFTKASFVLFVLIPAIAAAYYFATIASDQYETEIRLVVRTIGIQTSEDDGEGQVKMLGGAAVIQDAHIVVNYLKSYDIVNDLQADVDLRSIFGREGVDAVSRLEPDASPEKLHRYWKRHTTAYVDGPSGIIQFSVRTFTPEDAVAISNAAIKRAAALIENLSEQAKLQLLVRAQSELETAKLLYLKSLNDLRDLQNDAGILNPITEAGISTELIASLFAEKLKAEAELEVLLNSGISSSPVITKLRNEIATLDTQIEAQRSQMAGIQQEAGELSNFNAKVNALETERLLAEQLYRSASNNYDSAKSATESQSTFVSVFSPPILPTVPSHPQRLGLWVVFFSCLFAAWSTLILVIAAIDDHRR